MKLKTSIFLWVSLTTAAPLCAATLYANMYSERLYQESVDEEIGNSLDNIASEIRRRLLLDRDLLSGLSEAPPVRSFLPVLEQIANGRNSEEFRGDIDRLERFLESIQEIVSPTSRFRVLDTSGSYLAGAEGVAPAHSDPPTLLEEPIDGTGFDADEFRRLAAGLPPGEVRYVLEPGAEVDPATLEPVPLYSMLLALGEGRHAVGYIAARIRYQPIDRLLDVSPRPHQGRLFIAEIDPEDAERDGLIIYDDAGEVSLTSERLQTHRLQDLHPATYELVQRELFGLVDSPDGGSRTYYSEFLPYPDQLTTWVLGVEIDLDALAAPFSRVRIVILGVSLLTLLSSLALARIGVKRIALPITDLAGRLEDFAQGKRQGPIQVRGPDEVRQAGTAFNEMTSSLQEAERERDQARAQMLQKEKLASVGQMAAGIGHEINNPLHNILTLTKLMNRHHPALTEGLREDIGSVHEEAQRASTIVRGLLDFSRETPLQAKLFEVGPWLAETLALVEQEARQEGVRVIARQAEESLLEGDPSLLQQTLINLLLNGLQASTAGGRIEVTTSVRDELLTIEVQDQGSGIAPEIQDRIFDPFFTTKASRSGSGLGLSISLGIIAQHGGELSMHNRPEGGVIARIVLPRARVLRHPIASSAVTGRQES